ncbi:hypothetical protein WN48_08093 [Eufriesea mexicana]|uniref:Uncharacterized protein n=1 Tax=Eufriesea mexicana TaxID=516756 RepID=A0A310SFL9_9HYME|nr:hypothetical protein WN48_08093 [Eufriesea mexicana]
MVINIYDFPTYKWNTVRHKSSFRRLYGTREPVYAFPSAMISIGANPWYFNLRPYCIVLTAAIRVREITFTEAEP